MTQSRRKDGKRRVCRDQPAYAGADRKAGGQADAALMQLRAEILTRIGKEERQSQGNSLQGGGWDHES